MGIRVLRLNISVRLHARRMQSFAHGGSPRMSSKSVSLTVARSSSLWPPQVLPSTSRPGQRHLGGYNRPQSYPPGLSPVSTSSKSRAYPAPLLALATILFLPPELLKRILVTFAMLIVTRVGHYIAIPAMATTSAAKGLTSLAGSITQTAATEIPNNIYLLSITPYMTASLTLAALQLVPEIRRHIESLREEGRSGRETINGYQNILFVCSALIQSISYAFYQLNIADVHLKTQTAVTLMAGAVLCKFAVQNIDQFGLGDGTGVVIGGGIALAYAGFVHDLWAACVEHGWRQVFTGSLSQSLVAGALLFGTVLGVVWVQGMSLRLPLTFYAARKETGGGGGSGSSSGGGGSEGLQNRNNPVIRKLNKHSISMQSLFPLRLSPSGTRQLLFANFWASLLEPFLGTLLQHPLNFALLVFLLESLNFADATPKQIATFLAQNDVGIIGLSPGVETKEFLRRKKQQLKFVNAAFIAGVSLLARVVDMLCARLVGVAPGTLNVLLLVSTVLGGARQVEALVTRERVEQTLKRVEVENC
jgi:preprotein translocase subunit SecY